MKSRRVFHFERSVLRAACCLEMPFTNTFRSVSVGLRPGCESANGPSVSRWPLSEPSWLPKSEESVEVEWKSGGTT